MTQTRVGITGMGSYLPPAQLTNSEVARTSGVTEDWILRMTGIRTRYAAGDEDAASDLGLQALRSALAASGLEPQQLDLIVLTTSTPDEIGPATACRIQTSIGATAAVSFDMNAACSGWLFGASVVKGWFATHASAQHAALINVDVYTKFLDMKDRATAVLFSDGAVATIFSRVSRGGLLDIRLHSDGAIADSILIPSGGSRFPLNRPDSPPQLIKMNGKAVSNFAYTVFPQTIKEVLTCNDKTLDDIDMVVAHQPNPVLLDRLARKSDIPEDKLIITGTEVGNIGCACTPYALATAAAQKKITQGSMVLLVSFGAGMTWGGGLLQWTGAPIIQVK